MRIWQLVLVGLGTSIVALDTAVNVAFPDITRAFDAPLPAMQWVVVAYVLTYASFMLAVGHLGDLVDHRLIFRLGLGWSAAAFALCSLAPSFPVLLAGRVAQGVGAALVLGCGPALMTSAYGEDRRAHALGLYTLMFSLGVAAGPILGGLLIRLWGWPAVFWFRAPIALAVALWLPALPRAVLATRRRSLDLAGALFLAVAIAGFLLTIDRLRHLAEGDLSVFIFGGLAGAAVIAFIRQERRASEPVLDLALFRSLPFSLSHLGSLLVNLAGFGVFLLVPYYLARMTALSVTLAGLVLALPGAGTIAASPLAAVLVRRAGARPVAIAGAALSAAGLAAIATASTAGGLLWLAAALILQGFGLGLFQVAYLDIVTGSIALSARGVAGSLAMLTRTLGIVTGATLLTLVETSAEAMQEAAGASATEAFAAAFRATFWMAATLSAAGAATGVIRSSSRAGRR